MITRFLLRQGERVSPQLQHFFIDTVFPIFLSKKVHLQFFQLQLPTDKVDSVYYKQKLSYKKKKKLSYKQIFPEKFSYPTTEWMLSGFLLEICLQTMASKDGPNTTLHNFQHAKGKALASSSPTLLIKGGKTVMAQEGQKTNVVSEER